MVPSERGSTSAHREHTSMAIGLSEAAAATGVNRSTIYRAWKAGRRSAACTDTGQIEVEPAELFRNRGEDTSQQGTHDVAPDGAMADASGNNAVPNNDLERELQQLRDALIGIEWSQRRRGKSWWRPCFKASGGIAGTHRY